MVNEKKKGRSSFTRKEIETLRGLVIRKCDASRSEQKRLRDEMRAMGFYINDFVDRITSVADFDAVVRDYITILGESGACKARF